MFMCFHIYKCICIYIYMYIHRTRVCFQFARMPVRICGMDIHKRTHTHSHTHTPFPILSYWLAFPFKHTQAAEGEHGCVHGSHEACAYLHGDLARFNGVSDCVCARGSVYTAARKCAKGTSTSCHVRVCWLGWVGGWVGGCVCACVRVSVCVCVCVYVCG